MKYMQQAIEYLENSTDEFEEIPVVAIVVKNNKIISIAKNKKEKQNDITSHAEILAIREAEQKLKNWRLEDCDLYVTLEPCPMCTWAILQSRIKRVYFGSFDKNYGALQSAIDLRNLTNSKLQVFGGIMEEKCDKILEKYFQKIRCKND